MDAVNQRSTITELNLHAPHKGNRQKGDPVPPQHQQIGDLRVLHRILLVALGFVHVKSPDEDQ